MKSHASKKEAEAGNVIPLPQDAILTPPKRIATPEIGPRFKIKTFINASGTESFRVDGYKRDGTRVRLNFADQVRAQGAQIDLETEYLRGEVATGIKATKLSEKEITLAEAAFLRLDRPEDLPLAIEHWIRTGRQSAPVDSPRLDEAFQQFKAWLEKEELRDLTKDNLRKRVNMFVNGMPNLRLVEFTADVVFSYLEKRNVARVSKDNDRRALSRFFGFCMDRPRRWIASNPARKEKRERRTNGVTPTVLSLEECKALLHAAQAHRNGRLAPYVALCLFGGLRPFEASRVDWNQINLKDGEIRLEPDQTKTKTGRVITICDTLSKWLKAHEGKPIFPANWRRDFDLIKAEAGFGNPKRMSKALAKTRETWREWPDDVMRHTAISHYFRKTGSYGQTAEQFGNSEAIIKRHYQGRVTSEDTKAFYSITPTKGTK
jgi:integrase